MSKTKKPLFKKEEIEDGITMFSFDSRELTEEKKENILLDDLGISRDDLDDGGDMLEELKEITGYYES
tara:strand:- start:129 stop:332 length:204 start_codon:yes stop_codon:yes gene_type:complete